MTGPTIVLGSVGRQAYLVSAFRDAVGKAGRVVAYDHDPYAAALGCASLPVRSIPYDDPAFEAWLLDLCARVGADALITLSSEELDVVEALRAPLASIGTTLVGTPDAARSACRDKRRLHELCVGTGFEAPPTWPLEAFEDVPEEVFPVVVKPHDGRGSRGLSRIASRADLARLLAAPGAAAGTGHDLVQPVLGGTEFGLDLVNDLGGAPRAVFVRRKVRMRGGETDVATTSSDAVLAERGQALARRLGHQGLVDVDVIRVRHTTYLIDVNPRFGGGYIFSHRAGADVPRAIVAWLRGEEPKESWLAPRTGATYARVSTLQELTPVADAPDDRALRERPDAPPTRGG